MDKKTVILDGPIEDQKKALEEFLAKINEQYGPDEYEETEEDE